MSTHNPHVGDIGTILEIAVEDSDGAVDCSGATTKEVKLEKPDNTTVTKPLGFKTDGTDGVLTWTTTLASDLDQPGVWSAQVHIVLPSGEFRSSWDTFTVDPNL